MTLSDREILELNDLCDALVEGKVTGAQRARFEQLLSESDEARKYYVKAADLSASLSHYAGEIQMEDADAPGSRRRNVLSSFMKFGALAAAIALAVGWWTIHGPNNTGKKRAAPPSPPEYVARVTGLKDASWATESASMSPDGFVRRGQRLNLASGFAEVTFDSGAIVLMQGPAIVDVNSAWDSNLRRGTIRANVPPQALGFRVTNSAVEVVDLGTAFSMVADSDGVADVFVLGGEVEATPRGSEDSETVLLRANQSRRFARAGATAEDVHGQPQAWFKTDISLDRVSEPVKYAYWSFDHPQGLFDNWQGSKTEAAMASGFTTDDLSFQLSPPSRSSRDPGLPFGLDVYGFRNGGLVFDGRSAAHVKLPGISGNFPRTIAFWVKVPENAPLSSAYSMVAWRGDSEKLASRPVHVGWNRNPNEGPLGAVRTDFSGGHAMGTTPLRDNKWHFLTVIFMPGDDPNMPVQLKQYVDGRLESNTVTPGAKRSIGSHAPPASASSLKDQLWLGCRLGASSPKEERFLGEFDELLIVDRGLQPIEIMQLMQGQSIKAALHVENAK
jgi:hypothetical protein